MRNIAHVFKKELRRFFTDRRMLAALFMPGIIIAIFYSLMGNFMKSDAMTSTAVTNSTYVVAYSSNSGKDKPALLTNFEAYVNAKEPTNKIETHTYTLDQLEAEKAKVANGTYDLLIAFSDDFEITVHTPGANNHVDLYYYGASRKATNAYSLMSGLVRATYDTYLVNVDSQGKPITPNLAPADYLGSRIMSVLFPLITISLLFSTVVSICPDAVAGEKERGTMAAMLLTPVKRKEIAIGKSLALLVTSVASGAVSFLGIAISLPRMMSGLSFTIDVWGYVLMGFLILTTLTLFVSLGMLVSTLSKSAKEATTYLGPMTVIFVALSVLAGVANVNAIGFAFVPFLNISACMVSVLQGAISIPFFVITIAMSAVETAALVLITTRLFSSEKIMVK